MGKIFCAGLGPGDPELMSVKADRLIRNARHIAYFRKKGQLGQARRIVDGLLRADAVEYPMDYPATTEIPFDSPAYNDALADFYDFWARRLIEIAAHDDIVVLCEGDPFFYGSFMHLHARVQGRAEVEVVPGISGMSGCWTATGLPMAWGDDVLSVLAATLPEAELSARIAQAHAVVVMKVGRNLRKVRRAFAAAGRLDSAWLIERATMPGQRVAKLADLADSPDLAAPYFTIALAHGQGRRPQKVLAQTP